MFICIDLYQLLLCQLLWWAPTQVRVKFITMLAISQTSDHCNKYMSMQYNAFHLLIRTCSNTSIILLATILLSLLISTIIETSQSLCTMITSCAHLDIPLLEAISFADLIMCLAINFPVAVFILSKNDFLLSPRLTWKNLKGNTYMKSGNVWGQLSFAP